MPQIRKFDIKQICHEIFSAAFYRQKGLQLLSSTLEAIYLLFIIYRYYSSVIVTIRCFSEAFVLFRCR